MKIPCRTGASEGVPTGGCYTLTGVSDRQHNRDSSGEAEPGITRVRPDRTIPSPQDDARRLLLQVPRSIPPKYFYDARGSALFDAITGTPEYYPTRAERALLRASAGQIMALARPDHVLELGSGSSSKTRELLNAWDTDGTRRYWPFDVSESALAEAAAALRQEYPWLEVSPLVGDYSGGLGNFPVMGERVLVIFLGGTIGNFPHDEAVAFLSELARWMNPGDSFLIGYDRVKDKAVLEAAYNDAQGLTAEFQPEPAERAQSRAWVPISTPGPSAIRPSTTRMQTRSRCTWFRTGIRRCRCGTPRSALSWPPAREYSRRSAASSRQRASNTCWLRQASICGRNSRERRGVRAGARPPGGGLRPGSP